MKRLILGWLFAIFSVSFAFAACPAGTYFTTNGNNCIFVAPNDPLPIGAGFTQTARAPDLTATNTTGSVALGASAYVARVCNTSATISAYVALGDSSVTVTTANGILVPAGQCTNLNIGSATYLAGITSSSTAVLQTSIGSGLASLGGGGSGSSGGTGTVTSVSVTTQNGVSAVVTNPTTTPALAFTLGAITPSSAAIGAGSAITSSGPGGALTSTAYTATGTSGATIPLLSTANTWASGQIFVAPVLGTPASGVATNLTGTASGLTAGNVTTNANLTGVITSSGNATSIASQTGTGTKFVVDTSPTLVTPNIGVASGTSLNVTGNIQVANGSSVFSGTGVLNLQGQTQLNLQVNGNQNLLSLSTTTASFPIATASVSTGTGTIVSAGGIGAAGDINIGGVYAGAGTGLTGTAAGLTAGNVTAGWHTLARSNVEQTVVTGPATKQTSYSVVVPANTVGHNGSLRVSFLWTFTGAVSSKQVGVDWGGTTFWASNSAGATTVSFNDQVTIANRNLASAQIVRAAQGVAQVFSSSPNANVTGTIDTAADQTLILWVTDAGALDTGAIESVLVEYNND